MVGTCHITLNTHVFSAFICQNSRPSDALYKKTTPHCLLLLDKFIHERLHIFFFFCSLQVFWYITMDHMCHQGAAGRGVRFCVTVFCMFAANKQKNVHFLSQLADCCVSALPPSVLWSYCMMQTKKTKTNVWFWKFEFLSLKCSLRQTQTLLLGFSLPPVYWMLSCCLFLLPETPPAEGVDYFFLSVLLCCLLDFKKKRKPAAEAEFRGMRVVLTSARRSSSSSNVGVCLSLKDVAALKKHRFTLVSVLGSDQIELSFFIFVCLHCISPTDSNLNIIIFFACACAEFEAPRLPLLNVLWF